MRSRKPLVGFACLGGAFLAVYFGLVAMREEVHMAGGRYEISSRPGVGTTVWAAFEVAV